MAMESSIFFPLLPDLDELAKDFFMGNDRDNDVVISGNDSASRTEFLFNFDDRSLGMSGFGGVCESSLEAIIEEAKDWNVDDHTLNNEDDAGNTDDIKKAKDSNTEECTRSNINMGHDAIEEYSKDSNAKVDYTQNNINVNVVNDEIIEVEAFSPRTTLAAQRLDYISLNELEVCNPNLMMTATMMMNSPYHLGKSSSTRSTTFLRSPTSSDSSSSSSANDCFYPLMLDETSPNPNTKSYPNPNLRLNLLELVNPPSGLTNPPNYSPNDIPLSSMPNSVEFPSMQRSHSSHALGQLQNANRKSRLLPIVSMPFFKTTDMYLPPPCNSPSPNVNMRRVHSTGDIQTLDAALEMCYPPPTQEHLNSINEGGGRNIIGHYTLEERRIRLDRYRQKRSERNFNKKIKYACRKTLADSRPRIRGRFAKTDDSGDFLGENISKADYKSLYGIQHGF